MKDLVRVGVPDAAENAGIRQRALQDVVLPRQRCAEFSGSSFENFQTSGIVPQQGIFAARDVKRRAFLCSCLREGECAVREIKGCQAELPGNPGARRLPMEPAGDHEMENQEQLSFEAKYDALPQSPQAQHPRVLNITNGGLYGAQEKRARKADPLQKLPHHPRLKAFNIDHHIRQLWHRFKFYAISFRESLRLAVKRGILTRAFGMRNLLGLMSDEETRVARSRLTILIATCSVDMIGFAMVLPLLPFYALELKASPVIIGLIISSFSVAQLLSSPIWGRVSDRYGRRPALLIGLSASALAYLIFALADAVWLLFLSRLIQGAGGGTTGVAQAYVADTIPPEHRARALGWLSAATSAGVMVGPAIGSSAAHWGRAAPGLVAAALCVTNVVFAWRRLPESKQKHPPDRAEPRASIWRAAWAVVRHPGRPASRLMWIYAVGMLAFTVFTSILSLYLGMDFGFTDKTVGYVFLYVGALAVVMRSLCLGAIVDRVGEAWAMRLGAFSLAAGLLLYPLPGNFWALAAIMPLVPVGTALLFPSTTALLSGVAQKQELGATMGIAQTFGGIARMLAPILSTTLFQRFGHRVPFYVAGIIVGLVSLLAFQVEPARDDEAL